MIETHAHIYSDKFDEDREAAINRAVEVGVEKIYMPNIDHTSIDAMLECEEKYPDLCIPMMGVHPCSIDKDFQKELYLVEEWLSKRSFAAVGEIGLDLYWDKTYKYEQLEAFQVQIDLAKKHQLPIVIHSRNSTEEVIDVLKKNASEDLWGIFHCFGGTVEEANQITELGFKLGIGGVITYKNSTLGEVVSQIDMKHLVLETDCPYLPPVPHRGKRNEVSYLKFIADRISEEHRCHIKEVIAQTTQNAKEVFAKKTA